MDSQYPWVPGEHGVCHMLLVLASRAYLVFTHKTSDDWLPVTQPWPVHNTRPSRVLSTGQASGEVNKFETKSHPLIHSWDMGEIESNARTQMHKAKMLNTALALLPLVSLLSVVEDAFGVIRRLLLSISLELSGLRLEVTCLFFWCKPAISPAMI